MLGKEVSVFNAIMLGTAAIPSYGVYSVMAIADRFHYFVHNILFTSGMRIVAKFCRFSRCLCFREVRRQFYFWRVGEVINGDFVWYSFCSFVMVWFCTLIMRYGPKVHAWSVLYVFRRDAVYC